MSQRNPMNDRYQREDRTGSSRKSAASMKPKTKAAASVRVQPKEKTKQQKKAEKKAERQKQSELERKYYNPPTQEYKRLKKIWWGLLIAAIIGVAVSFLGRSVLPEAVTYVFLGLGYVCIIAALYVDFSKIRKARKKYQEEMESKKTKEMRAAEKRAKAAQKAEKAEAAEKYEAAKAAEAEKPKKRSLFGKKAEPKEGEGASKEADAPSAKE